MWDRKKSVKNSQKVAEVPWDEETQAHFAEANRFDIHITSVTRRLGFGATEDGGPMREPDGYEIHGIITFPKLILVELSFEKSDDFGGWFYGLYNHSRSKIGIGIPVLVAWVSDTDTKKQEAIYASHMASLISGKKHSSLRLWKRKGDGLFNDEDKEHGYSYSSRYSLLGMHVWGELEASDLPRWSVPYASEHFSLDEVPDRYMLGL